MQLVNLLAGTHWFIYKWVYHKTVAYTVPETMTYKMIEKTAF